MNIACAEFVKNLNVWFGFEANINAKYKKKLFSSFAHITIVTKSSNIKKIPKYI